MKQILSPSQLPILYFPDLFVTRIILVIQSRISL